LHLSIENRKSKISSPEVFDRDGQPRALPGRSRGPERHGRSQGKRTTLEIISLKTVSIYFSPDTLYKYRTRPYPPYFFAGNKLFAKHTSIW
jgi:hypothetical protein